MSCVRCYDAGLTSKDGRKRCCCYSSDSCADKESQMLPAYTLLSLSSLTVTINMSNRRDVGKLAVDRGFAVLMRLLTQNKPSHGIRCWTGRLHLPTVTSLISKGCGFLYAQSGCLTHLLLCRTLKYPSTSSTQMIRSNRSVKALRASRRRYSRD